MLGHVYSAINGPYKEILLRAQREKSCTENLNILRKYINNPEQNVNRNMDDKGHSDEVSDGNEEYVIGNWRKGD